MIKPFRNKIQVDVVDAKAGGLVKLEGIKQEVCRVLAVGPDVKDIQEGDTIFVKAWAIDIFTFEGKTYNFVSEDLDAICAIVTD